MNWLSVAEIAKLTRIPAPTARRYASLFKDFLGGRRMGRVTKYPEESVVVFERISRLYSEGRVTAEIDDALRTEFPRTIDVSPSSTPAHASEGFADLAETFNGVIGKVASCMEVIANQKATIDRQQDDIQKLKTAFVLLARSQKKMKALPAAEAEFIPDEFLKQTEALQQKDAEIEEMALKLTFDTSDIKAKLQILESELVRLRKDRREMEKFLQEKIDRLKEAAS